MKSRRIFLKNSLVGIAGAALFQSTLTAGTGYENKEGMNIELVKDFVINCHRDLNRINELYQQEPRLIFCSHDWGNGDFENGIEAAGHIGNKKIANFLLSKGARINFFTMCMLGKTELVAGILKDYPEMVNAKGPHGFTPLHHAIQGGENAVKVKELLLSLGASETKILL